DLLRRLVAGPHHTEVVELSPFRRAAEEEGVAEGGEVRLTQEARDYRKGQQENEPRVEGEQRSSERCEGDGILQHAEQLCKKAEPCRRLAASSFQLVVELGVLELGQVQRGRVAHEPDAHPAREPI